jgi:hypothetical protein
LGDIYQRNRFHAKQLQLMQSLHHDADGLTLPPDNVRTESFHPVLLWLRIVGYPFPTCIAKYAQDVAFALAANHALLLFAREFSYPADEGPHLWRAAVPQSDIDTNRMTTGDHRTQMISVNVAEIRDQPIPSRR